MDVHFGCTQCGQCCRNTKVPLTVAEAIDWVNRGHEVQLLCDASPWPAALDSEPRALHFKRRSFAVTSGSMPMRVVVTLVANVTGDCPNLLADMRCGIYDNRPLVCRIYPAEINPHVMLQRDHKSCPPEAWTPDQPLLQRRGALMDAGIRRQIEMSQAADALDVDTKSRLCLALNLVDAALVHEAVLAYSPTAESLSSALALAVATDSAHEPAAQWRFVSAQPETLKAITQMGGIAFHLRDVDTYSYQHLGFNREAIFDFNAGNASWPRDRHRF